MGFKGFIFILLAIFGAVVNFTSRNVAEKTNISEIKIKICALIMVFVSITLLFIFGK